MDDLPKGQIVFTLIFGEKTPYSNVYQFEKDFAEFFLTKGLIAYKVPNSEGQSNTLIYLSEAEKQELKTEVQTPKAPSKQVSNLTKKMMKGK